MSFHVSLSLNCLPDMEYFALPAEQQHDATQQFRAQICGIGPQRDAIEALIKGWGLLNLPLPPNQMPAVPDLYAAILDPARLPQFCNLRGLQLRLPRADAISTDFMNNTFVRYELINGIWVCIWDFALVTTADDTPLPDEYGRWIVCAFIPPLSQPAPDTKRHRVAARVQATITVWED